MPSPRWWVFQKLNGFSFVNKGRGHCCEPPSGLVFLIVFLSIGLSLLRFDGLFMHGQSRSLDCRSKGFGPKASDFQYPVSKFDGYGVCNQSALN